MMNSSEPDAGHSNPIAAPLLFPARLYGRETELAALTQAFAEVGMGAGRVLLLPGHSGSGKTALVQALRHPIREKNGFFLEGKFNQYQLGIPLFALRQVLRQLARELRTGDPSEQQRWKAQILEAVGNLGGLLTDLAPEWEAVLGPQPPMSEISPYEAPHRFASVLRQFLSVFCRAEHPVVLFVDDWQWADAASLAVLQQLHVNTTLRYLLVLAAYRDTEVDSAHPFMAAVEELRRQAVPVVMLTVCNLSLGDVRSLLGDTLVPAVEALDLLASWLHATTQGNPFFLRALLESLHASRALWFDPVRNCWYWNRQRLVAHDGTDDVVQLFVQNLRRLPAECRDLLALAACLGNRFDLEALAMVSEQPAADCLRLLDQALQQRVILPLDDTPGNFLFQHDRVQQAAHSLITPGQLPKARLKIARLLQERSTPPQLEERLLEVVDHFNAGRGLLRDDAEQMRLVELNVAAGCKARRATAYRAALQFHRVAGEFLARPEFAETFWKERHGLALQLYKDWAESEFLEGERDRAEGCICEAVAHALTPLEQADALCLLILQNTLLARYPDAIAAGRQALATLGITLPEADFEAARDVEIAHVRRHLAGRTIASLRDVPPMTDLSMLMATRVLITMGPPCYRSHQRLWSVLVPKVVDLTLQFGPVPQIGYSHTAFGGLLGWVDNDYATAGEFGTLATSLMREVFPSPSDLSVFHLMNGSSTRHWFAPLRAASEDYAHAWEVGLRSGNLQYAAYAFGHNMYCRFYQGVPLDPLIEESQQSLTFSRTWTNQWAIDLLEGGLQVFGSLAGRESSLSWQEAAYLQAVDAHQNTQVACIYRVLKAFASLILNEPVQALAWSEEAEPLIYTVGTQGLLPWPEHVFTRLLILAALFPQADAIRQAAWRGEMDRAVGRLEIWTAHAPENYRFKLAMARGEIAGLEGRTAEALGLYEEAVEAAQAEHFTQWEAWGNERAAQLALACGEENLAQVHWQNAYLAYYRWGAMAKVGLLERGFLSRTAGKRSTQTSVRARLERHVEWLRAQAARLTDAASHPEPSELVRELSQATENLREEVARRKEVEGALRESEARFSSAFEYAAIGIALVSPEGRWLKVNRAVCHIFGYTTEELLARTFQDITHPDDLDADLAYVQRMLAGEIQTYQMEKRYFHKAGHTVWVLLSVSLVRDAHGRPLQFISQIQDITDRKRAEEALRASENEFRSLAEAMPQIVWVTRPDGWNIYFNRQWCDYTGLTLEESYGHGWNTPFHPDDRQRAWDAWQRATQHNATYSLECRLRRADGAYRWWLIRGVPFRDEQGEILKWFGTCTDIDDMRRATDEIRQINESLDQRVRERTAELRAANEELEAFAYAVSHDLRQPLRAMNGFSQALLEDHGAALPPAAREYLDEIILGSRRMGELIDGLLRLSRSTRGELRCDAMDLSALAGRILGELAAESNRRVTWTVEPGLTARGDERMIEVVLANLLGNAWKYTANCADARIEVGRQKVEGGGSGNLTLDTFFVRDNGAGFDMRHAARIFQPFQRLHREDEFPGLGIGLATVQRIVHRHGGTIRAIAAPGQGAEFLFSLSPAGGNKEGKA